MGKKKRILFGAIDIGYRIELYTKFIMNNYNEKLEAESFSKYVLPKSHYETNYTFSCDIYKKSKFYVYPYLLCFFIYALFRYDILHFISGETILTRKMRSFELWVYKKLRKRIVMHFVGEDIRSTNYTKWKNNHLKEYLKGEMSGCPPLKEKWQEEVIADALKYADEILVSTPDLLSIIPSAKFFPVLIDLDKFYKEFSFTSKGGSKNKITILHSPSNKSVKGSETIYAVLDCIKKKLGDSIILNTPGKHNPAKYYTVSRYELLDLYKDSDYVVDQLTIGWYGLQSIEALLAGNAVFCYIEDSLIKYLPQNYPIINVNADNLEERLIERIKDLKLNTEEEFTANIEWVKQHHTIENNNKILIAAWGVI